MKGKTVLITGATAGIGFYTAQGLASRGAKVIITGRNPKRGEAAVDDICSRAGHNQVEFIAVDHSVLGENHKLAEQIIQSIDRLDVLVNNCGGIYSQRLETKDGFEATLATNFLGPFTLTNRLLPFLQKQGEARIININSSAHEMWKRDPFEDVDSRNNYIGIEAYAHAKLLNILWTFAFARKLGGSGILLNATNPGMAWTPGTQAMTSQAVPSWRFIWPLVRWMQRRATPEKASRSSIFLASSKEIANASGGYFESNMQPKTASANALNTKNQERAWKLAAAFVAKTLNQVHFD